MLWSVGRTRLTKYYQLHLTIRHTPNLEICCLSLEDKTAMVTYYNQSHKNICLQCTENVYLKKIKESKILYLHVTFFYRTMITIITCLFIYMFVFWSVWISVFQVREGSQIQDPRKLAFCLNKLVNFMERHAYWLLIVTDPTKCERYLSKMSTTLWK